MKNDRNVNETGRAFSYVRFSTPDQEKGNSTARQTDPAQAYCLANGLRLVDTVSDKGISGFHGKNHTAGNLGRLLKAMQPGDVLLIEHGDRWSREDPLDAMNRLRAAVNQGISVVFLKSGSGQEITADNFNDLGVLVPNFFASVLANLESKRKGDLSRKAWTGKRQALAAGQRVDLSCLPRWLTWNEAEQTYTVDTAKAAIVKDIFKRAARGQTITELLRALQPVPTFRHGKVRQWSANGLRLLLKDKAVIGLCTVIDPPAPLYPPIVPEPLFFAVQAARGNVVHHVRVRHGHDGNLFAGLGVCAVCGLPLVARWGGHGYGPGLQCSGASKGRSKCGWRLAPLAVIEKAVLAFLADGDLIGPLLAGQSQGNRLAELEGRVEAAQKRAAKLLAVIEGDSEPSKLVYASLKASEAEAGQAQQALEAERERVRTERPAAQAYDQFMAALPALAKDPGQRGALRQAVASVVEKLVIDPRGERRGNVKRWEFAVQLRGAKDAVPILALKDGAAFPSLSPYPRIAGNLV